MADSSDEPSHVRGRAGWGGPRGDRRRSGERLLPPATAVVAAAAAYGLLPDSLLLLPRLLIPALEGVLLVALLVTNPWRRDSRARWSRLTSILLSGVIVVTNLGALAMLVTSLGDKQADGASMLLGAMQVWLTGIIGFALLYWEIDRGGPVARHTTPRDQMPLADWRFSQDENDDAIGEVADGASARCGWMPEFVDYAYLSVTNSSAFSPTDTMPLSARAKVLMGLQATAALMTSLLVVARAVGSISGG